MKKLPLLPKKLKKVEAKFTTAKVAKWVEANLTPPAIIEVKHTRGKDSFPFKEIRPKQRLWLLRAMAPEGKWYKHPDTTLGEQLPDGQLIGLQDAWIIIKYPKFFVVIGADRFFAEEKKSLRKSLTDKRAKQIAEYVV
jgi:hypothetical protein